MVVAPMILDMMTGLDWVGLGWTGMGLGLEGLGTKGLGTGLDNMAADTYLIMNQNYTQINMNFNLILPPSNSPCSRYLMGKKRLFFLPGGL